MKKLLLLILILPFFISCSDDENEDPTQDYTSLILNFDKPEHDIVIIAHLKDGIYYRIKSFTVIPMTKTEEIIINDNLIDNIYIFSVWGDYYYKSTTPLTINYHKKNEYKISTIKKSIVTDRDDPTQYPQ